MFTISELEIINIYIKDKMGKAELIETIQDAMQYVEDPQIREDMASVIQKLEDLPAEVFCAANFVTDFF